MYESSIARHFAERGRREGMEEGRMLVVLGGISERFDTHTHTHTHTHTCTHTYSHTHTQTHTLTRTCTHTHKVKAKLV